MQKTPDETKKGLEWDEVDKALQKVRFDDADDDDARRPKTSVDIKKGLHHCSKEGCGGCPYEEDCFETDEPFSDLAKDSFALIQQLQTQNDTITESFHRLKKVVVEQGQTIMQLEAERDAAVRDIEQIVKSPYVVPYCDYCKYGDNEEECAKRNCFRNRNDFEWRGVQKEG